MVWRKSLAAARCLHQVFSVAGVDDVARGRDHQTTAICGAACTHHCLDVAALGANAKHPQGHAADKPTHPAYFLAPGSAGDQHAFAMRVPVSCNGFGHTKIKWQITTVERLEISAVRRSGRSAACRCRPGRRWHQRRRGKLECCIRVVAQMRGEFGGFRIEVNADQRIVALPGCLQ